METCSHEKLAGEKMLQSLIFPVLRILTESVLEGLHTQKVIDESCLQQIYATIGLLSSPTLRILLRQA
jgi:hypothetical protein